MCPKGGTGFPKSQPKGALLSVLLRMILKHIIKRHAEDMRNAVSRLEAGGVFALFNRGDGLACHANPVGQLTLRHFIGIKA